MSPHGNEQKSSSVFEDLPKSHATGIIRRVRLNFLFIFFFPEEITTEDTP